MEFAEFAYRYEYGIRRLAELMKEKNVTAMPFLINYQRMVVALMDYKEQSPGDRRSEHLLMCVTQLNKSSIKHLGIPFAILCNDYEQSWAEIKKTGEYKQRSFAAYFSGPGELKSPIDRAKLHKVLQGAFDLDEMKDLCFQLGIDYDDVPGTRKTSKIRELILQVERSGRTVDLIAIVQEMRPHISLEDICK